MRPEDMIAPALRALDAQSLEGLTIEQARDKVERAGGLLRAIGSDEHQGLPTVMTADWRSDRITVVISAGEVVESYGVG